MQYRFAKDESPERFSGSGGRYGRVLFDGATIPGAHCSLGVIRYEPGGAGQAHAHEIEAEIFFCLQGVGEVEFLGEVHRLEPGVAVYVPPGVEHQIRNTGGGDLEFLFFYTPAGDLSFIRDWRKS